VAYYLEGLGAVAGLQDDPGRAERLYGAAEALLETAGRAWLDAYASTRHQHDLAVDETGSAMEKATLEEARAQGRVMGRASAMEYALKNVAEEG